MPMAEDALAWAASHPTTQVTHPRLAREAQAVRDGDMPWLLPKTTGRVLEGVGYESRVRRERNRRRRAKTTSSDMSFSDMSLRTMLSPLPGRG